MLCAALSVVVVVVVLYSSAVRLWGEKDYGLVAVSTPALLSFWSHWIADCTHFFHCTDQAALVYLNALCSSLPPPPTYIHTPPTVHWGACVMVWNQSRPWAALEQQLPINTAGHMGRCACSAFCSADCSCSFTSLPHGSWWWPRAIGVGVGFHLKALLGSRVRQPKISQRNSAANSSCP